MESVIFVSCFFIASVSLMPIVGFSYKICERLYKRSLFAKSARQIQLFSAVLLLFSAVLFGADYCMQGILFGADAALAAGALWGIGLKPLLLLACCMAAVCLLCFAAAKFSKSVLLHGFAAAGGIILAVAFAKWINLVAVSAVKTENAAAFSLYCLQFLGYIFAVPDGAFSANPYALLSSVQFFSYLAVLFVFLFMFLYALYFVCVLSFVFRNAMDYGRDYYVFMLNKYGRAIFVFSLFAFLCGLIVLLGFMLPFQPSFGEYLKHYGAGALYIRLAFAVVPVLYCLCSLKLKKNFCLAAVPMQKKSNILVVFVTDFAFAACVFFLVMHGIMF